MNYKKYIAIKVSSYLNLSIEKIENSIVTPSDIKNGDYSLLCFKLNEKLNKSPAEVSSYLKLKLNDTIFEKIEVNGAYLNFFIDKYTYTKNVLRKIINNENKCIELYNKEKYICIENSFINKNEKFNLNNYFQIICFLILPCLFIPYLYHLHFSHSSSIFRITTSLKGRQLSSVSCSAIESTISIPSITSPKTVYSPSKWGLPPMVV